MKNKLQELEIRKRHLNQNIQTISKHFLNSYEEDFAVRFAHESTKMEGNTLSIFEVKTLLVDQITIGGKKLRELYEVINHQKAFEYVKKSILENREFTEELIKDLHQIITENIFPGGIYRQTNVRISGASFIPIDWTEVRTEMSYFIEQYTSRKRDLSTLELAAWVHAEFVKIHPFSDGNGRTARLLMNYILMADDFLPINISTEKRAVYYESLDQYAKDQDLEKFLFLICEEEEKAIKDYEIELQVEKSRSFAR